MLKLFELFHNRKADSKYKKKKLFTRNIQDCH